MLRVAHAVNFERERLELKEDRLATLYLHLVRHFPINLKRQRSDFQHRDIDEYRNKIIGTLRECGTPAACRAIEKLIEAMPTAKFLNGLVRDAKRKTRQLLWRPPSPSQFLQLVKRPDSRLVTNEQQLTAVVVDSLKRLEGRLQGALPAARDLWDRQKSDKWRPVDELDFSDYIARHLDSELLHSGIVALREVEVTRPPGAPLGARTDLYVTATIETAVPNRFEKFTIVVENKGCWNATLKTAMNSQLKDSYLVAGHNSIGIYVIGWFRCGSWNDPSDKRRLACPDWNIAEARQYFEEQAEQLSDSNVSLHAVVLDAALPAPAKSRRSKREKARRKK